MPLARRPLPLLAAPLMLGSCGEYREAVPLTTSVPLAVGILGLAASPMWAVFRWAWRRPDRVLNARTERLGVGTGRATPSGPVRRTQIISLVMAALLALPTMLAAGWLIGLSFADAHVDVFTYEDVVIIGAVLAAFAAAWWCAVVGIAGALCSASATVRGRARVVAWVATAVTVPLLGIGIPLAPMLGVLLFTSRRIPSADFGYVPFDLAEVR